MQGIIKTLSLRSESKILKTKKLTLCWLLLLLPMVAAGQNIALSFDDGFNPETNPQASHWNAAILASLSAAEVNAIYFVTGQRVDSSEGLSLVSDWGKAGHIVANHTYSHLNLSSKNVSLESFITDVKRNEQLLKILPGWEKRFRFPYLKEGNTLEDRDGFRQWLTEQDYKPGAVSIDASDWSYNQRYLKWLKHHLGEDESVFLKAYLDHLWNRASYYDELSHRLLNRSIDHVILLHANAINAAFLPDIIAMFNSKGWTIISPSKAYEDAIYYEKLEVLPAGESVLWSTAKQQGVTGLRYPAEDSVYEKPILDVLGL